MKTIVKKDVRLWDYLSKKLKSDSKSAREIWYWVQRYYKAH